MCGEPDKKYSSALFFLPEHKDAQQKSKLIGELYIYGIISLLKRYKKGPQKTNLKKKSYTVTYKVPVPGHTIYKIHPTKLVYENV